MMISNHNLENCTFPHDVPFPVNGVRGSKSTLSLNIPSRELVPNRKLCH